MNIPRPGAPAVPDEQRRALISALVDGDAAALQPACELWRSDPAARADWHTYQLIGDVLRSDDLASTPARDAAFLAGLRERLAAEPAVLAPAPVAPAAAAGAARAAEAPIVRARRAQRWLMPAAAAAGFVAVAGVLVVTRTAGPGAADEAWMAGVRAPAGAQTVSLPAGGGAAPQGQALVIEGRLIRDPRLDAYLDAHRQVGLGASVAVPGGAPRNFAPALPAPAVAPVAAPLAASR